MEKVESLYFNETGFGQNIKNDFCLCCLIVNDVLFQYTCTQKRHKSKLLFREVARLEVNALHESVFEFGVFPSVYLNRNVSYICEHMAVNYMQDLIKKRMTH